MAISLTTSGCGSKKAAVSCDDVEGTIPPLREGMWLIQDSLRPCNIFAGVPTRKVGERIDTVCAGEARSWAEYHYEVWDAQRAFFRQSPGGLLLDCCEGMATDSTTVLSCRGGWMDWVHCIPAVELLSTGTGDSLCWTMHTTIRSTLVGDSCQIGDFSTSLCVIVKRVYTRLGDTPDPCPADSS